MRPFRPFNPMGESSAKRTMEAGAVMARSACKLRPTLVNSGVESASGNTSRLSWLRPGKDSSSWVRDLWGVVSESPSPPDGREPPSRTEVRMEDIVSKCDVRRQNTNSNTHVGLIKFPEMQERKLRLSRL